jgi:hypothetical protein
MSLTKCELLRQVKKFLKDPERGISHKMFAQLCGIDMWHMRDVFLYEDKPLSETMQIRVNKGYESWKQGLVRTMKRRDNSTFVDYRKEAVPLIVPSIGLQMKNGKIGLRIGLVNRRDYSQRDLNGE